MAPCHALSAWLATGTVTGATAFFEELRELSAMSDVIALTTSGCAANA